jgi:hypothetical protein
MLKVLIPLSIFLSAFLSFLCQPLLGNFLVPRFGGGIATWGICLTFFQTTLFSSYLFAHVLASNYSVKIQRFTLIGLFLASATFSPRMHAYEIENIPALGVLVTLFLTIGLPYFSLCIISPLLQTWFRDSVTTTSPFKLYALSNLGSLLGLISYPFGFEPYQNLSSQFTTWSLLFLILTFLLVILTVTIQIKDRNNQQEGITEKKNILKVSKQRIFSWVGLSSISSALLVSFTSYLTEDIAPIPLLWIIPLCLFLISYIIIFSQDKPLRFRTVWWTCIVSLAIFIFCIFLLKPSLPLKVLVVSFALFNLFLLCNLSCYNLRPNSKNLTLFYLSLSFGGALGGSFVSLISPLLFNTRLELPMSLVLLLLTTLLLQSIKEKKVLVFLPHLIIGSSVVGLLCAPFLSKGKDHILFKARDFYGIYKVTERELPHIGSSKLLVHGNTIHGIQSNKSPKLPLSYYSPTSGLGLAFESLPNTPRKVAAIGLGTGTIAAYLRPEDSMLIAEISQTVCMIAKTQFSFLQDSQGAITIKRGDGRQILQQQPKEHYDMIVLDAFNSDSIPIHLYTKEAIGIYSEKIKKDGLVVAHVSNRNLNIKPALVATTQKLGLYYYWITSQKNEFKAYEHSEWIIFTKKALSKESPIVSHSQLLEGYLTHSASSSSKTLAKEWTDESHSLLPLVLRSF